MGMLKSVSAINGFMAASKLTKRNSHEMSASQDSANIYGALCVSMWMGPFGFGSISCPPSWTISHGWGALRVRYPPSRRHTNGRRKEQVSVVQGEIPLEPKHTQLTAPG